MATVKKGHAKIDRVKNSRAKKSRMSRQVIDSGVLSGFT
jgi:hypothetical protein